MDDDDKLDGNPRPPKPGVLKISLAGVTLWERGEELSDEEHERRAQEALKALHAQAGLQPPPSGRRQGYAGAPSSEAASGSETNAPAGVDPERKGG